MKRKLSGLKLNHNKNTENSKTQVLQSPEVVRVLMKQHIGAPATPAVKKGDQVFVGTLIGDTAGKMGAPIHSSISGTVLSIDNITTASGESIQTINIQNDMENKADESISVPICTTKEEFIENVRLSGAVGLGGAGFPTYMKFNTGDKKADILLVNAAECEPYIISDYREMVENPDGIISGIKLIMKNLNIPKAIICIENNKPEAMKILKAKTASDSNIEVLPLKSLYPQGAEKVMIYNATGRTVMQGQLPIDQGVIVSNVNTIAFIDNYFKTGIPLVNRRLTLDGDAINNPGNYLVPIGTKISDLVALTGGYKKSPQKILMGGPMMGIAVSSDEMPIVKNNNAILCFSSADDKSEESPCIRCGRCLEACPYSLMPAAMDAATRAGDTEDLKALNVNLCMECGSCAYVCPAKRHLVMSHKLGKQLLRKEGK